jgi:hypothetical protein
LPGTWAWRLWESTYGDQPQRAPLGVPLSVLDTCRRVLRSSLNRAISYVICFCGWLFRVSTSAAIV